MSGFGQSKNDAGHIEINAQKFAAMIRAGEALIVDTHLAGGSGGWRAANLPVER